MMDLHFLIVMELFGHQPVITPKAANFYLKAQYIWITYSEKDATRLDGQITSSSNHSSPMKAAMRNLRYLPSAPEETAMLSANSHLQVEISWMQWPR